MPFPFVSVRVSRNPVSGSAALVRQLIARPFPHGSHIGGLVGARREAVFMTINVNKRIWFSTRQAAELAGMHPKTVRNALEAGELVGSQRREGGHWRIHRKDLNAWLRGETKAAS